jgi:glyoxylase-like metal-dependent hydrolase (beta-lactamase superfamily II)
MRQRKYLIPDQRVIELNYQAGHPLGVNVFLIDGGDEWALIDVGYLDTVGEIIDLLRGLDFSLAKCKYLIATHADADHIQGLARAKEVLKCQVVAHPASVPLLASGDPEQTFARITAQDIDLPLPPCKVDLEVNDGDVLTVGDRRLTVWHTPGHTAGQLAFKMGPVLFVGDNLYKDGCVGVIDAHHGSNLPHFIQSLERILADDAEYLLPSHGPAFRRDNAVIRKTIERLTQYQYMADFGTCAVSWPLQEAWKKEVLSGRLPDLTK